MILAIDIGNTNIVVGCIDDKKTYFIERLATVRTKTELEYAVDLKTVLDIYHIKKTDIDGCIISSVVPQITNIAKLAAEKILKKEVMVLGPGVKTGLNIMMDCEVVRYQTAGDDQSKIADEIREAWKEADLILTTGGVSVGEKDLLPGVIENLTGNVLFHGIQVKPGMPTMLSVVKGTPVLSLSGNPFAVEALFEVLAGGYLTDMEASRYLQKNQMKILKQTFVKTGKMKRIVKGRCDESGVDLPQIQKNGQLKNGIGSNCLVIFPEGERTYAEGEAVRVIRI